MQTNSKAKTRREQQEFQRLSAIELRKNGATPDTIARSFNVIIQTVYNWTSKAKRFGADALKATKTPGAPSAFPKEHLQDLADTLRRPASELGYATDLWSGPRVRHFIKHRYGINYHPGHMPRFLRRMGLTQKFPGRRALEQDSEAVRAWKEERLPEILAEAKKRRALVFYADEAVVSLIPNLGKTWTFPEQKPVARVSGRRGQNVGVTGAVNPRGDSVMAVPSYRLMATTPMRPAIRLLRVIQMRPNGRHHQPTNLRLRQRDPRFAPFLRTPASFAFARTADKNANSKTLRRHV